MADTPTKLIVDCSTGERTIVELTAEEIAEREQMAAEAEAQRLAKAKLVAGEALTAEEADTLVL
jgi:hypothetical protein